MGCRRIEKRLSAYQDHELEPGERRLVEAHLQACPACRLHYARIQEVGETLKSVADLTSRPDFYQDIAQRVKQRRREVNPGQVPFLRPRLALGALALAGLLFFGIFVGTQLGSGLATSLGLTAPIPMTNTAENEAILDNMDIFSSAPTGSPAHGYLQLVAFPEEIEP